MPIDNCFINVAAENTVHNSTAAVEWVRHSFYSTPGVHHGYNAASPTTMNANVDMPSCSNLGAGSDHIEIGGHSVINACDPHLGSAMVDVQSGFGGGFSGGKDGHDFLLAGTGATMDCWGGHDVMTAQSWQATDMFHANSANGSMAGPGGSMSNMGMGHADIMAAVGTDLFDFTDGNRNNTYISGSKAGADTVHSSAFATSDVIQGLGNAFIYQGSETQCLREGIG